MLWSGIIAGESTSTFSSDNTGNFLYSVLALFGPIHLFGAITGERVAALNADLRILGHLVGYGILSWLAFRAWRTTLRSASYVVCAFRWMALAVVLTAAIAGLDEWHQSFLPSRAGKPSDVLLDTAAAVTVQLFIFVESKRRRAAYVPSP